MLVVFAAWLPTVGSLFGGLAVGVVVVWLGVMLVAWLLPVDPGRAGRAVDVEFGLPDHVLSASELMLGANGEWTGLQRADTEARLAALDWTAAWPMNWPRFSVAAGVASVLLGGLLILRLTTAGFGGAVVGGPEGLPEEAAAIEEMLQDWEKAAEQMDDPELRELVAELQPLRDELPNMSEREMLLALSKLENRLEALRESAAKNSLETMSADLAAAMDDMEGMGALAAALRRKEFEEAAELAEKEAQKLGKNGAQIPKGAELAATQEQMARAAGKLQKSGQSEAAQAMNQTREGAQNKNAQQMGKGMGQLSKSLGKAGQSQSAKARLGLQLAQLGQMKNGIGQGDGPGKGMSLVPKLSQSKNGKGAGSETDPNREKDPTQSGADRSLDGLTGMVGEGDSEVENLSSDTPGEEAPRNGREARFAQYKKLSEQAITDENLPLAYRETIRKYFEAIRPVAAD